MEKLLNIVNMIRFLKEEESLEELKPEMDLRNDLGFNSFDLAELTVHIEDEFEIDIFGEGLVNTIGDIQKILSKENA
jgi:acyl carrier protein